MNFGFKNINTQAPVLMTDACLMLYTRASCIAL